MDDKLNLKHQIQIPLLKLGNQGLEVRYTLDTYHFRFNHLQVLSIKQQYKRLQLQTSQHLTQVSEVQTCCPFEPKDLLYILPPFADTGILRGLLTTSVSRALSPLNRLNFIVVCEIIYVNDGYTTKQYHSICILQLVILLDVYVYGGLMIDSMMETTKVRYILHLNFSLRTQEAGQCNPQKKLQALHSDQ